ncbi:MAG: N-6 DNA methylase [Tessaracoccus sp.]|uniref:Eco57I restriction-modification methylase domain-containing protein n=1 Tax=Tessaracoccus sp. TaxID=1971211 RepID=UPI001ECF598C|nr:helicase-related protein [Tessaracoccus sp.]MBK7823278.1 N-6 DNA methylase [Tessaracoccus sp.]
MRKELRFGRVLVALSTEGSEFTVTITSASSGAVLSRAVIEDEAQLADVTGKLLALKAQNKAAPPPPVEAPTPPTEAPAPPPPAAEQAAVAPRTRTPRAPRSALSAPEVVRSASAEALAQTASLCEQAETMLARVEKLNRGKPDLWTEAQRTDANLCAMWTLHCVEARGDAPTDEEQTKIGRYSGWGGLSHEKNLDRMPSDVRPEIEGLLDEYYTPSNVAADVVRVIREKWEASLPQHDGTLQALEPSAGIGRFIRAAQDAGLPARWTAIEFSNVSARMLQASMPTVEVNHSSFEKWAQGGFGGLWGKIGLILSNPPYPESRGDRAAQDFASEYSEPAAFIYFIRRALDALAPKGIGVMVVPSGFLSGVSYSDTRAKVLQRHHLLAAFRTPDGIFPGAKLNIDVLFFEARGGTLAVPNKSDADVIAGRYFETHRGHILGTEKGTYGEGARWDYKVLGTFNGFPAFDPRPLQTESELQPFKTKINYKPTVKQAAISGDPYGLDRATTVGARVRSYFSLLADGTTPRHVEMWPELHADLLQWKKEHGNPRESTMLRDHAPENNNVAMFLSAWDRAGELVAQVATQPQWMSPIQGNADDMAAVANALWRGQTITLEDVGRAVANARNVTLEDAMPSVYEGLPGLYAAGWRLDGERFNVLVPSSQFLEGEMWPRYDNAGNALVSSDILRGGKIYGSLPKGEVEQQRKEIIAALKLPSWEDINQPFPDTEDPRRRYTPVDRWVPFDIIKKWIHEKLSMSADRAGKRGRGIVRGSSDFKPDTLSLSFGAIAVKGVDFSAEKLSVYDVDKVVGSSNDHAVRKFIGWYNHMNRLFIVRAEKESPQDKTTAADVEKAREEVIRDWIRGFYAWIETPANEENRERILNAYHRVQFGYLDPKITAEPLNIKRWTGYVKMHPWQNAGARRVLRNRTGLVAFDVGVGKTFTGIGIIAKAREEGWVRHPVLLVPNSIVWKWYRDVVEKCLGRVINGVLVPEYKVCVIGSKEVKRTVKVKEAKTVGEGRNKHVEIVEVEREQSVYEPDTPADRGEKWSQFQRGEYDLAIVTYSVLGMTEMDPEMVVEFVKDLHSVRQSIALGKERELPDEDEDDVTDEDEDDEDDEDDGEDGEDDGEDGEAKKKKEGSERNKAKRIVDVKQFVADKLKQRSVDGVPVPYDIGPRWDDIGVDMIVVDEAQNFKNLFATERKWKYMSSPPKGSKRAWNLFFRCASVRKKQGGGGVVLLSATPAKNSPLEFYSILSYLDPKIWENIGINNQEQFVDRFIEGVEITAISGDGKPKKAIGAVAFKNLDEIRRVLNRWGEFKTPLDIAREYPGAGIRLPEPTTRYIDDVGNSYSTRFRPNVNFCYDGEMANLWFNHKGEPVHIVDVGLAPSEHQRIKDRLYRTLYVEFQKAGATDPKMRGKALALVTRRAMIAVHPCLDECAEAHTEVKNGNLIVVNTKTGKRLTTPDGSVVSAVQFLSEPRAYGSKWSIKSAKEVGSFQSPKFDACAKRIAASLSCGQVVLCPKGREDETMEILQRFGTPANVMIAVKHEDHAQDVFRLVSGRMRKPGEIQVVVCSEEVMLKARAENLGCQRYTMPFGGENVDGQKEVARAVFGTRTCGHVIFLESIAGHVWLEKTLVHYGVDPTRIAVLNGKTAPSPGKRLAIADAFNGDAEKMVDPLYDVVIANSVAYEGIDLQQRTCAIHHVDLPWEPATLHQRNGRGVRQGNKMGSIEIAYYFGRCSGDALRFNMIGGKRGWMVSLLQSQDLKTNNPAAGQGIEGVIGMVSCSREEAEEALSEACVSQVIDERKQTKSRVKLLLGRASYACARSRYASAQGFKGESIQVFRDDAKASVDEIYAKVSERSYPFLSRVAQVNDYLFPPTSELTIEPKRKLTKKEEEEEKKRNRWKQTQKEETPQHLPFYVRADGSEYTHDDDRAVSAGGKVKPAGGDEGEDKYDAPEPAEKKAPTSIRVYPIAFILPPVWESCRMKLIQRNSYGSLAVSFSHYGSVVAHAKAVTGISVSPSGATAAQVWATKDVIGHRKPGSAEWKLRDFGEVAEELHAATRSYVKSKHAEYDFNNPPPFARRAYCLPLDIYDVSDWPDDDHETVMRAVEVKLKHNTALELKSKADPERYDSESRIWEELAWYAADETWLARYWGIYAPRILMDLSIPGSEYQSAGWIAGRWQVGGDKPRQGLYNIGNKNLPGIAADGSFSLVPRESITKENVHEKLALVPMPTYANLLRFREALSALNPKRSANTYGTFNAIAIAWWGESLGESVIGKKFSDVTDIVDAVMVWIRAGKPTDQKIRTLGVVEAIRQSLEWIDKERGLALSGIVFSEDPAVNGNSGNLWDALVAAIPAEKMDDVRSELIWDVRKRADLYAWNDPETRKKENELQEKPSELVRGKTPSEDEGDEDGEEDEGYES